MDLYNQEVIAPGDKASALAKEVCFASHNNCPAVHIVPHQRGNFRGPVGFAWNHDIQAQMIMNTFGTDGQIKDWRLLEEIENDGAGGKLQFHALVGTEDVFAGAGWEIIAMTADDFARSGRLPCIIDNELQAKAITEENFHLLEALFYGYGAALKNSHLVNITGETAVMKHSITAFCDNNDRKQLILTWGASCLGLASRKLLFRPEMIRPGMLVIGLLESEGYRCNGGTFFTNLILSRFGSDPRELVSNPECIKFVKKLTAPSTSYASFVCRLAGWLEDGTVAEPLAKIKGAAHITGGGIWGKFGELLPEGVGANLNSLPDPPEVLLEAQEMSMSIDGLQLSDDSAYSTLHGGCGMILVVEDSHDVEAIFKEAEKEVIIPQVIGTTDKSGKLKIASRFSGREILKHNLRK